MRIDLNYWVKMFNVYMKIQKTLMGTIHWEDGQQQKVFVLYRLLIYFVVDVKCPFEVTFLRKKCDCTCCYIYIYIYDVFTTQGYIYKPDGLPMSSDASTYAYDAFNSIADQAERYHKGQYQKHLKRSQNKISNNHVSFSSYISR